MASESGVQRCRIQRKTAKINAAEFSFIKPLYLNELYIKM